MEGEPRELDSQSQPEPEPRAYQRVELSGEHKIFVKQCTACGSEFRTSIPRSFFKRPNDESDLLTADGLAMGVDKIIAQSVCPDVKRNALAMQQNGAKEEEV